MVKLVHRILSKFGYSLNRVPISFLGIPIKFNFLKENKWLRDLEIDTIIDVGANTGQFAAKARYLFPNSFLYSIEPLPDIFQILETRFAGDSKFKGFNIGVGDRPGSFSFFRNSFSDSSSLLPMKELHKELFPFTKNEQEITIKVDTLDHLFEGEYLGERILLKMDTQGLERQVIEGGRAILSKSKILIIEVSFVELYESQPLFDDIYSILIEMGFRYSGSFDQLISPKDGQIIQADAIFIR